MKKSRVMKTSVFMLAMLPLGMLIVRLITGALGVNPIETITHDTGTWALRFLLLTLVISPLRRITGWRLIITLRRTLGLFAFLYAAIHFMTYVALDQALDLGAVAQDVVKRPYVTAGFAAFAMLVPLAITSTRGMIRRLGRRWRLLHRLIYSSAALAVLHYLWLVKADLRPPLIYGFILAGLLGFRVWDGTLRTPESRGQA